MSRVPVQGIQMTMVSFFLCYPHAQVQLIRTLQYRPLLNPFHFLLKISPFKKYLKNDTTCHTCSGYWHHLFKGLGMSTGNHEPLVFRLAQILVKLNQGERLDPSALAAELGVNLRTIQRDLNVRFAYLPLQKTNGRYHLDQAYLGKLSTRDIERFASLAGVRGLFPSLSNEFLGDIFDNRIQSALLVKGHNYEDLAGREEDFRSLERAIVTRCHVSFNYRKGEDYEAYSAVAPLKLVNNKGIWYLVARDGNRLKTFSFSKIERLVQLATHFSHEPETEQMLRDEDGIWLGEE